MDEKQPFLVPAIEIKRETLVANSKFITTLAPARSVEEARAVINRVQKEFPDATHHVTAYIIGSGNTQVAHCSDAGEPAGSSGRPALSVLQGSGLGDVVVIITRYFGGTKLGIGGLVRAYGDAVRSVIKDLPISRKVLAHTLLLHYDYPLVDRIRKLISIHSGEVLSEDFGSVITMLAQIPVECTPAFDLDLADLTSGKVKAEITQTGEVLLPAGNL